MPSQPRIRRIAKWAGLFVCVLTGASWALFENWHFNQPSHAGIDYLHAVQFSYRGRYIKLHGPLLIIGGYSGRNRVVVSDGWFCGPACPSQTRVPQFYDYPGDWALTIPLWNLFLASTIATSAFWMLDC